MDYLTQQKQYLKRTTLRRLTFPLQSIRSKEGPHYRFGAKREQESCHMTSDNQPFFSRVGYPLVIPTWAGLRSLADARKCQLKNFVRKKGMSHISPTDIHSRRLSQGSERRKCACSAATTRFHERLAFEKPLRSVPETWGGMYNVLTLRN